MEHHHHRIKPLAKPKDLPPRHRDSREDDWELMRRKKDPSKKKRKLSAQKHNQVKPDDDLTSLNEENLARSRNDKLIKKAEKQMEFDNKRVSVDKGQGHHSGHGPGQDDPLERNRPVKPKPSRVSKLRHAPKKTHEEGNEPAWISNLSLRQAQKTQTVFVWDAVAIIVIIGIIFCLTALILEIEVFVEDFHWNNVLKGEAAMTDTNGQGPLIFDGKTFDMDGDMYLIKAREYAMRSAFEELAFLILISFCLGFVIIHLFGCYIRPNATLGENPWLVVGLHATCGALCILSSLLLVAAVADIENNFEYSADMLYNFQHKFDNEYQSMVSLPDDCSGEEFQPGCETYEYNKNLSYFLENIFRLCARTSRYSKYYNSENNDFQTVQVFDVTYTKTELTNMGFCAPDGLKYLAAFFAIIAGILFAIIPVIYCCEGRAPADDDDEEVEAEVEVILPPEEEEVKVEVVEAEEEVEVVHKKQCPLIDRCAIIKKFRTYVENDTEPEEEPWRKKKTCGPRPPRPRPPPAPVCRTAEMGTMCCMNTTPQITQTPVKVCRDAAIGDDTHTRRCAYARGTQCKREFEAPAVATAQIQCHPCTVSVSVPPPVPAESPCDYCTCDDSYCQCDCGCYGGGNFTC